MLTMPIGGSNQIRIVGIDPGSTMTGISVLNVDLNTCEILSTIAWSINGAKLAGKNTWNEELYGNRYTRVQSIENTLIEIFNCYQPTIIISEAPFINQKFPAAGIALTEVMCSIRRAVMCYDNWVELKVVSPSSVKNGINAVGGAGKDVMKEKLTLLLPLLKYCWGTNFNLLDEHSIDAIAVGFYGYLTYVKGINV